MTTDLWSSWDIRAFEEAHPDMLCIYRYEMMEV